MRLQVELVDAIEDLSSTQVQAIQVILSEVVNKLGSEVLKCSIGDGGEASKERLMTAKCRHEGAMKVETLLIRELQNIRTAAENRRPA